MKSRKKIFLATILAITIFLLVQFVYSKSTNEILKSPIGNFNLLADGFVYFPSAMNDGRFLSLVGRGADAFIDKEIEIEFIAPKKATSLYIGIFDGETSGIWDEGTVPLEYEIYADPEGDGSGSKNLSALKAKVLGSIMPDNEWFNLSIETSDDALSKTGYYFYTVKIYSSNNSDFFYSNFKIRTYESVYLLLKTFSISVPFSSIEEAKVIYPNFDQGDYSNTTYNGEWSFSFYVSEATPSLEIWDGDLDFGSFNGSQLDTDDLDTTGIPSWATGTEAKEEGIAVGWRGITGNPHDDSEYEVFRRSPAPFYELIAPNGKIYLNNNPSGNLEWEGFRINSNSSNPADYYISGQLSAGLYQINLKGVDISNFNSWRFQYPVVVNSKMPPPKP